MKIFLVLIFFIFELNASTEFERVYDIYKLGNYESALKSFKILAEENKDYDAAYILGYMYEHGEGCSLDIIESQKWYKISSNGYYWQRKVNPGRDIDKEWNKHTDSIKNINNEETLKTIKQYIKSLYNIKAHKANYFLPFSYRANGKYTNTNGHEAKKVETEFQVSIEYNFAANIFDFGEIYSVAYTQKSYWQFYSQSAYFRESNYNPEIYITVPFSSFIDNKYIKGIRTSLAHQSNGRGGLEERSWNYLSAAMFIQYKSILIELKTWDRLPDTTDYNPNFLNYYGHGHVRFILPYKKHLAEVLLRNNFKDTYAVEATYTYPAFKRDDLFFYLKVFNGYGESLIDYDNFVNKIGFGFSISR